MNFDLDYVSGYRSLREFEKKGDSYLGIVIKRFDDIAYTYRTKVTSNLDESYFYVKKIILTLIWMVGGNEVVIVGNRAIYDRLYSTKDIELSNSFKGMETVFKVPFKLSYSDVDIEEKELCIPVSGAYEGERIGFDAGGSDRKVTATKGGKVVYSEEVLWLPKEASDWIYHRDGIVDSLKRAAAHLDHVDAVGVSSAGIIIDDEVAQSNLFIKVDEGEQSEHVRTIFQDIVKELFGDIPLKVSNDGDVTALGGEMFYHKDHILGLAMGTSEAAGYSKEKSFNGWINELGKVPIDYGEKAIAHYATGIKGSGSEYLSQKGIIRLAEKAGFKYEGSLAERLVKIQKESEPAIFKAYEDLGVYLADAIALYSKFLDIRSVLLLGRVMSGLGGERLLASTKNALKEMAFDIDVFSADEDFKRLGQSYTAAALPKIV